MPVVSASLTDQGLRRPANEDSFVSRPGLGLYVVCDGMGGHAAGEIASRVAADTIEAFVQQTEGVGTAFTWPFRYHPEWGVDGNRLACALLLANRDIAQRVVDEPELRGMATTAVCLLLTGLGSCGTAGLERRQRARRPEPRDPRAPEPRRRHCPLSSRMSATAGRTCGATANWIRSRATTRGSRNRSRWAS